MVCTCSAAFTDTNYGMLDRPLPTVASATELGEQWVQSHFEEIDSVAALRALPAADLLKAQESGYNVTVTVDGAFMPDHAANIFARGEQMDVPVIAGTNTDEDTIFFGIQPFNTVDAYRAVLEEQFGDHMDAVLKLYPATDAASLAAAKNQLLTDTWFVQGTRNLLPGMARVSSQAWQYHFSRRSPAAPVLGAFHGMEIGAPARSHLRPNEACSAELG